MLQKIVARLKIENSFWYPKLRALFVCVTGLFGGGITLILLTSEAEVRLARLYCLSIIFVFFLLAMFSNITQTAREERAWRQLAKRTGLTCLVQGSFWLGFSVQVLGRYRGRELKLLTYSGANANVPTTRIELKVKNVVNASMRLRGPFHRKAAMSDLIARDLFAATSARQFGGEHRFFVRSQPLHLVTNLLQSESLWDQLSRRKELINIELEGSTLFFEKLGILGDTDYLHNLFDILIEIAEVIETGSKIRSFAYQASGL